jgi:hypothetical protein
MARRSAPTVTAKVRGDRWTLSGGLRRTATAHAWSSMSGTTSAHRYRDGRCRRLFVGPGDKLVLRSAAGDAFFVWRSFHDACVDARTGLSQAGINCAAFRNEGTARSSELVRQADAIADCLWPGCRHYTYVNAARVQSRNPGYCFLVAGWRRCGFTKGGLLILERT